MPALVAAIHVCLPSFRGASVSERTRNPDVWPELLLDSGSGACRVEDARKRAYARCPGMTEGKRATGCSRRDSVSGFPLEPVLVKAGDGNERSVRRVLTPFSARPRASGDPGQVTAAIEIL